MTESRKPKFELSVVLSTCSIVADEFLSFVKQCLGKKKIVIISEKGISSIPVSFKSQVSVVLSVMALMLWVSYSSGKYFAYEDVMSEKERELWSTNVTNENLQYQVADLHKNLTELNNYFDKIKKFDQISKKDIFDGGTGTGESSGSEGKSADSGEGSDNVQGMLSNIREKVLERISSLETIIEMTGLKVEEVAENNEDLKRTVIQTSAENHQGGPYVPADSFDSSEFEAEMSYLMQLEKAIHSFPLAMPLQRYWISSGFGKRMDPMRHEMVAKHSGVDMVGGYKAKVYSSAPGIVKYARPYGAYGRLIEVQHGSGLSTRYGHLDKIYVKEGEEVERGQLIGVQGSTGRSTGPHLHYEVRYNGRTYDPVKFLKAGKYVF